MPGECAALDPLEALECFIPPGQAETLHPAQGLDLSQRRMGIDPHFVVGKGLDHLLQVSR
ncbi:hypothetical protein PHLH7_30940 [Pseudomonas sp. Ost2]|nr:hypothetical protein PHLH7_30940 [Pseudomonas sp. Ost2]